MAVGNLKALVRLARLYGIEHEYTDELGRLKTVSPQNLSSILNLLGAPINGEHPARELDDAAVSSWLTIVPPSMVVKDGSLPRVWHIHLPIGKSALSDKADMALTWALQDESGAIREHRASPSDLKIDARKTIRGSRYVRVAIPFPPDLQPGYYQIRLDVQVNGQQRRGSMRLIVVPERCYLPPAWEHTRRAKARMQNRTSQTKWWGLTVQLYGLRSRRNWGIGDFRDLASLMRWAGRLGAAMVGVNPLHALSPGGISPYSPSSRLFHNPLYLDVESIAEFKDPGIQSFVRRRAFQRTVDSLRQSETVNYEGVAALKWPLFKKLYRIFSATHLGQHTRRDRAFQRFKTQQGQPLQRFALFQALQEHLTPRGAPPRSWREWPIEFQHPDSPAVQRWLRRYPDRMNFYGYLEWQCDEQLMHVQSAARRAGMRIGLYTDFAIGIDPSGADAWMFQDDFVQGASVGAPPDVFSPKGQNWGLAPPHPKRIVENGYQLFVEGFRRNMRHSGLFRLDHAMGLFRLFWVPEGRTAADGAYVSYPSQDLLGILALESRRHRVIVVGEDLGTVTPEIRSSLMGSGLLSYRLLLFEKSEAGRFFSPQEYPAQAMTAVTTHDLPTLRGFWTGRDIELKEAFGLYPDPSLIERDREARDHDKQALLAALKKAHLLPKRYPSQTTGIPELDDVLSRAVYTFLARTPSRLLGVPLEDLLSDSETPNLPGASDNKYPIWRIKAGPAGSTMETWSKIPTVRMLAQILTCERPLRQVEETGTQLAS
jgi:4-alpha-glucanotransferase